MTPEEETEIRSKINPAWAQTQGTESYERRIMLEEIDALRAAATCGCGDRFNANHQGTCPNCMVLLEAERDKFKDAVQTIQIDMVDFMNPDKPEFTSVQFMSRCQFHLSKALYR